MRTAQKRIDQSVNYQSKTTNMNLLKLISTSRERALKSALVKRLSLEYADLEASLVARAVNEADALASLTFAPLLVLPVLAEEKVQQLAAWSARQHALWSGDSVAPAMEQFALANN